MRFITNGLAGMAVLASLSTLSACSLMDKSSTALPYGDWQLNEVSLDGQTLSLSDSENRFTLALNAEGNATGQVACNRWNGSSVVTASTVQVENAGSTRKRCHFKDERVAALEGRYLRNLKQPVNYQLKGGVLQLTISDSEQWRFSLVSN
jgi:heat shock protein HslJ